MISTDKKSMLCPLLNIYRFCLQFVHSLRWPGTCSFIVKT